MRRTSSQEVGKYDPRHNKDVFGEMIEARQSEIVTQGPSRFRRGLAGGVHRTDIHFHLLAICRHITARKIRLFSTCARRRSKSPRRRGEVTRRWVLARNSSTITVVAAGSRILLYISC